MAEAEFVQLTDEDIEGLHEQARQLRRLADQVAANKVPWVEGDYEARRLEAAFFFMPLFRQAPWPEGLEE
jgi:hypothetical protein